MIFPVLGENNVFVAYMLTFKGSTTGTCGVVNFLQNKLLTVEIDYIHIDNCKKDLIFKRFLYTCRYIPSVQNRQKTVWKSAFLFIQYSEYSAMLSKKHSYRLLFFGDFAYWVGWKNKPCLFEESVM